ncbi:MAG: SRPBCC domain-containing protein [Patescibacteria group bacterium]
MGQRTPITVTTLVHASIEKVWEFWTKPVHIVNWAFASDDWEAPYAENDARTGGKFRVTMSAKDKSSSFEFEGVYTNVKIHELLEYDMTDDRHVKVEFTKLPEGVQIIETFDAEETNSQEMQRAGWLAILNNFKKYMEG